MTTVDVFAQCASAQDLGGESGTVVTSGSLKLSESSSYLRDIGAGQTVAMRFYLNTAITGTTSVEFQAVLSSATTLASDVLLLGSTGAVVSADLTVGAYFDVPIPAVPPTLGDGLLRQHLGGRFVIDGTVTTGSATVGLVVGNPGRPRKFVTGYTGP